MEKPLTIRRIRFPSDTAEEKRIVQQSMTIHFI